jgi:hypothetical protein
MADCRDRDEKRGGRKMMLGEISKEAGGMREGYEELGEVSIGGRRGDGSVRGGMLLGEGSKRDRAGLKKPEVVRRRPDLNI